jgi:hydroxymethylbilane synthase
VLELVHRAIHDEAESRRVAAERTFLARMGGSCQTPLAAHAVDRDHGLTLIGMCGMPDGSKILRAEVTGTPADAEALGTQLAEDLLARGAADILAATKD